MKFKKGDEVKVSSRTLLQRTKLLLLQQDPKELKKTKDLFLHLGSFLHKEPLKGIVVGLGARREDKKECYVGVKLYNRFGKLKEIVYFGAEQLRKIK